MTTDNAGRYLVAVGLDGSEGSWKALDEAIAQARQKDASLHMLSIQEVVEASHSAIEILSMEKTAHEKLEKIQAQAKSKAEAAGLSVITSITSGQPAAALVDYVKKHKVDLLVVGDTGHSSIWGALLGNMAEKIARNAPCSVLIVR